MNKDFYKNKIEEILSDTCYYEKLECDPYHQTKQENSKLINNDKHGLTEKKKEYLLKFEKKKATCMVYQTFTSQQ